MVSIVKVGSELSVNGKGPAAVVALSTGGYAHAWFEADTNPPYERITIPWVDVYDANGNLLQSIQYDTEIVAES
jgi:hypothetical protein